VRFGEADVPADFDTTQLALATPAPQGDDRLAEVFGGIALGEKARQFLRGIHSATPVTSFHIDPPCHRDIDVYAIGRRLGVGKRVHRGSNVAGSQVHAVMAGDLRGVAPPELALSGAFPVHVYADTMSHGLFVRHDPVPVPQAVIFPARLAYQRFADGAGNDRDAQIREDVAAALAGHLHEAEVADNQVRGQADVQ